LRRRHRDPTTADPDNALVSRDDRTEHSDRYPAVFFNPKAPEPSPYFCYLDVGISDSSFFNLSVLYWSGYRGQDACATATKAAQAVLSTIKTAN
jgi:hypothetical protein